MHDLPSAKASGGALAGHGNVSISWWNPAQLLTGVKAALAQKRKLALFVLFV
jgi:hypothetical protein